MTAGSKPPAEPAVRSRLTIITTDHPGAVATPRAARVRHEPTIWSDVAVVLRIVFAAAVIMVAVRFLIQAYEVDGPSMQPTLFTGELLVIDKSAYLRWSALSGRDRGTYHPSDYVLGGPERGDIAVFHMPLEPDVDFIKRVIGLPGDQVLLRDANVYVNGRRLEEPGILEQHPAGFLYPPDGEPYTVPEGYYFVLGDNRPESDDSHLGWVVPAENLVGRAWLVAWPMESWRALPRGRESGVSFLPPLTIEAP